MKPILFSIRNSVIMSFCHQYSIPHLYHNNMMQVWIFATESVIPIVLIRKMLASLKKLILMNSPPSSTASTARIRKGAVLPTNSYMTLPNGGPTAQNTHTHIYRILHTTHRLNASTAPQSIFTLKTLDVDKMLWINTGHKSNTNCPTIHITKVTKPINCAATTNPFQVPNYPDEYSFIGFDWNYCAPFFCCSPLD